MLVTRTCFSQSFIFCVLLCCITTPLQTRSLIFPSYTPSLKKFPILESYGCASPGCRSRAQGGFRRKVSCTNERPRFNSLTPSTHILKFCWARPSCFRKRETKLTSITCIDLRSLQITRSPLYRRGQRPTKFSSAVIL